MPGVQEFSQQVRSIIDVVIRFVRARKREEAAISFGALLILGGTYLADGLAKVGLKEFFVLWHGDAIVRGLLITAGIGFVLYGGYKIFRLVYVPPIGPEKNRPSAIKGPMAFTEADGELFRKLGRESELQKLLGLVLDDQVLMVVVRGASGAGKTSLLRAGLKHILGDRSIFHYWEAVPTEPDKGLLRAIQEKWPEGATKPATLDELVNPVDGLGRQSHVIVLDQFEQLRGSRKIFSLLRRIVRESKPPHRIIWVIAFRREFSADWMDFVSPEIERGIRPPQDVSLRLFTPEQAREVIGQLVNESNLKDSIEQSVINNLVEAATVEGEVSPVDIGIGLLVLAELHERQSGNTITIHDYQFAGGAEGLLTQYISRCLDLFPNSDQEAILKAMLALRDAETNQRLAEGLTVDELAAESGAEARLLKTQLDRLSHRDTRLLETVTPADGSPTRYRLPHERLVPALYRLTGKLLAEVDQAKLKFQNAFQAWKNNDKRSRYLLRLKERRLVERYETQIPWGNDEQEKKNFLLRSQWRHKIFKGVMILVIVLGPIMVFWDKMQIEVERYLDQRDYASTLSAWQPQLDILKKLELTRPLDLERFVCFPYQSIEELSLIAHNQSDPETGLVSISKCHSLKKLTLDLGYSKISDLKPLAQLNNLQELTLDLNGSEVRDLKPLAHLGNLTRLTLGISRYTAINLEQLENLNKHTQLTLYLRYGSYIPMSDMKLLSRLSNLKELRLYFPGGEVSDLEPLAQLRNLTQLMLNLRYCPVSNLEPLAQLSKLEELKLDLQSSLVSNLEPLAKLSNLTQLMLNLSGSQVINLEPLANLSNQTQLSLDLRVSQVSNLEPLAKLTNSTQLMLDFSESNMSKLVPLAKLHNRTQLTLKLSKSSVEDLKPLKLLRNLRQLALDLSGSRVTDLETLTQLSNLKELNLNLSDSHLRNVEMLTQLNNLKELGLDLRHSQMSDLEPMSHLINRAQLTISLGSSQVSNLEPLSKLSNLTQLTLDLSHSQVSDLEPLSHLINLKQLTIKLSEDYGEISKVSNLEPLSKLMRLQRLSIDGATRAQRMSLRKIPASLVELKF